MKQSEIINANFMKSPFAQGASYTNKTSKRWSDDEVKGGFKKILSTNGANNGYLTLEDLNRLGYNITESTFSDDIGLVPFFDYEYCNAIGGYPKGAHIFGIINGNLVEAISLVDNNKVDFQMTGIDNINWYSTNSNMDFLFPSCTPKRKLITLDVGGYKSDKTIDETKPFCSKYPNDTRKIHYVADKSMYVGIDLSEFTYNLDTFVYNNQRFVNPFTLNMLCFIGGPDSNINDLTVSNLDMNYPLQVSGSWFLNIYSPYWNGLIYSFIAPGYKDKEDFMTMQIGEGLKGSTESKYVYKNTDIYSGIPNPFYMNEGDQLVIFTWGGSSSHSGDVYKTISDNPTKIYFSEY